MDEQDGQDGQGGQPINPKAFRAELDAVLRRRDPAALRAFLIARRQWSPETTTDPEMAMWMMIAASPALADLRAEAEQWLRAHGHAAEADAILGRAQSGGSRPSAPRAGAPGGPGGARNRPPGGPHPNGPHRGPQGNSRPPRP